MMSSSSPELATDDAAAAVASVQADWNAAMARWNVDAVVRIYHPDAQLFGSLPRLFVGRDEIGDYFRCVRADACLARFDTRSIVAIDRSTILTAGFVEFTVVAGGVETKRDFRLTFVLRRENGLWFILSHHASPRL